MTCGTCGRATVDEFGRLVRDFPGWVIWRSGVGDGAGWWWATRNRLLTEEEMYAEMHHTVCADDAVGLRGQLERQCVIEKSRAVQTG
jgi:hypothetical protein